MRFNLEGKLVGWLVDDCYRYQTGMADTYLERILVNYETLSSLHSDKVLKGANTIF